MSQEEASSGHQSVSSILGDIQQEMEEISILTNQLTSVSTSIPAEITALQQRRESIHQMISNITIHTQPISPSPSVEQGPSPRGEQQQSSGSSHASQLIPQPEEGASNEYTPAASIKTTSSSSANSNNTSVSNTLVNINNLGHIFNDNDMFNMDSIKHKNDNDFRLILQNPNGIAVYKNGDPEYLPSMESFKQHQADLICLSETNVPWHKHDLLYDITKQNQIMWRNSPTKTIAASCRTKQKNI